MRLLRRPLLLLGAACTLVVSLSGQTVRVLSVSGEATLQAPGDSAPRTVKKGDTIVVGTRIVTGEGARVILTPLPGVNSIIAPKSEVVIERVSVSNPAGTKTALHSAVLDLKTGAVTTDLKPTEGVELDYGVRTARGLAGARGTTYTVGINAAGIQTIVVADGLISLTLADGRVVNLIPGQVSITQTDGGTQAVNKATDLSTGDQAIADNWVETTLDALAEAVEQGIDIDPAALEDAIRAARELGIDIDADTQSRLDRARDTLAERRQARLESGLGGEGSDNNDDPEIITERGGAGFDFAAFLASLAPEQRQAFLALPAGAQTLLRDYIVRLPDDTVRVSAFNYSLALGSSRFAAFFGLGGENRAGGDTLRALLVAAADPAYTAYALDPFGEGQTRPAAAIAYAGNLSATLRAAYLSRPAEIQEFLVLHRDSTSLRNYALTAQGESGFPSLALVTYFQTLGAGQRLAFVALDPARQASLASLNDPGLTAYALGAGRTLAQIDYAVALSPERRALFLTYSPAAQGVLVANPADTDLAAFAYATNDTGGNLHSHAAIVFYAGLAAEDRVTYAARPAGLQQLASTDSAFASLLLARDTTNAPLYTDASLQHYLTLGGATREAYLARAADVRDLFAALAKPGLTASALDPATFEAPPTDADLRRNLSALLALSPENQTLFQTFAGGPAYPNLEAAPSPYEWSDAAWTRTRNSWTALPSTTQNRILGLGATDGLFDYSATYIEAAFQDYDAAPLSAADRSAILSAGWGRLFAQFFGDETLRDFLPEADTFSAAALETIRLFDISPYAFASSGDVLTPSAELPSEFPSEGLDARERLATLAALSLENRRTLAKLLAGDDILHVQGEGYYDAQENYVYPTYAETLANALAFAQEFSADLATLAETGLGQHLFNYAPDATIYVGDSATTARERLAYLLGLYRGLSPERRDLARDLGLFDSIYFQDLNLEPTTLGNTLDTLAALSPNTRDYLADVAGELPLFEIVNGGEYSGSFYTLSEIDGLLSTLSPAEFATLRELKPGSSILRGTYSDGGILPVADLKAFLGYVASLGDLQRFTLNELGITGRGNERKGLFLSDHEGLGRLLAAYSQLPAKLRVETRQVRPYEGYRDYSGRSFFFASDDGSEHTTFNVTFSSPGDLHVGATRRLSLYADSFYGGTTFQVPGDREHDVHLRASTLIDLNGTSFSPNVRAITMEAATLNLANIAFPEGSVAALTSRTGQLNFGGSVNGAINFISGNSYGGTGFEDLSGFNTATRGNIATGSFASPATLPNYTPPPLNPPVQ